MAIVENIASEVGDVIRIKTEVPVVGLLFLDTFTDSTEGESPTSYFNKEFRYSNDAGMNFTAWQHLNLINIQDVVVEKKDQFILEYRYEVVGSTDPELRFNSITVSGEFENLEYPIYNSTLFNKFFDVNDINVMNWAINVLEKLYRGGILPEYVKRNESIDDNAEDKDFITYWNTVTHFFALIVYFYRQYEDIAGTKVLMKEFLEGKDIGLPTDDNLTDLSYLLYNYISEYRKRGTERIVYTKEENGEVDGEFLRVIGWKEHDEMLFALSNSSDIGWCLGLSSPMWEGTENIVNLTKAYEYTEEVKDLTKYPLVNPSAISIVYDSGVDKDVMQLDCLSGTGAATGIAISSPTSVSELINITPYLDYEISFYIKKDANIDDNISFRCIGYNEELNQIGTVTLDGLSFNSFVGSSSKILTVSDEYYLIRGVLFNFNKSNQDITLNFNTGRPLRMQLGTKYISVQITIPDNVGANFYLYDFKVKPLSLPMTQGLLGVRNIIFSYINNRGEKDNKQLENFVQKKLIPYNSWFKPYYW